MVLAPSRANDMMTMARRVQHPVIDSILSILLCAVIATSGPGCGVGADPTGAALDRTAEPQNIASPSAGSDCVVASAGDGFVTLAARDLAVLGIVDFTVTASAPQIDAVIGLSAGPPARFSDLAVAVRLAP